MNTFQIDIPSKAACIIETLMKAGYEAYVVGGCVRDSLLGRRPKDWDITTSAHPQEIKALFPRTIDTGIQHGTVTVMMNKEGFEVTTYRIDGEYEDSRHPKSVVFTNQLVEDLKRRDFTINAMAYNPVTGLVDAFDGVGDLQRKVICCVGEAEERFDEDALRIMRAVRFAAQLGFEIEAQTKAAISKKVHQLANISAERVQQELVKLLISPNPQMIELACDLGITAVVLPEYDSIRGVEQKTPNHIFDVEKHTLVSLKAIEPTPILRLTMLMHDFGKPSTRCIISADRMVFYNHPAVGAELAEHILRRLKFDNYTREHVVRLIRWHGLKYDDSEVCVRRVLNKVGADLFPDFLKVQRADIMGKNPKVIGPKLALLDEKEKIYQKIIAEGQCFTVKQLAVTGRDILTIGVSQGPELGRILDKLTAEVIEDQSLNTKEQLLARALVLNEEEQ